MKKDTAHRIAQDVAHATHASQWHIRSVPSTLRHATQLGYIEGKPIDTWVRDITSRPEANRYVDEMRQKYGLSAIS